MQRADAGDHPARRLRARPRAAPRRSARAARDPARLRRQADHACSASRPTWLEGVLNRRRPVTGFVTLREEIDALHVRADRRAPRERRRARRHALDAARRPATRTARRCPTQELRDELMTLLIAGHETTASTLAWAFERLAREPAGARRSLVEEIDGERRRRLPDRDDPGDAAPAGRCCRTRRRGWSRSRSTVGGWHYPPGVCLVANAYLAPPRSRHLSRPLRVPARALPRGAAGHLHLDPVRRRAAALPRRQLRAARDGIVLRAVLRAYELRAERRRARAGEAPQHHRAPGRRRARGPAALGSARRWRRERALRRGRGSARRPRRAPARAAPDGSPTGSAPGGRLRRRSGS